jgi:hypothetical protein
MSTLDASHDDTLNDNARRTPRHTHVPGYAGVLVREDVKDALRRLRDEFGLHRDSQVERCLVTAMFDLVLNDPSLHEKWLELYVRATERDVKVTAPLLRAPRDPRPSPSPQLGAVTRAGE